MLLRIIRDHLGPYKREVTFVVILQFIATMASLSLPSLNADIINNGVVVGDTGYILRIGLIMLAVALVQVAGSMTAIYFAARTGMGVGRDLRRSIFNRVGLFSAREMGRFGAPSLITRTTNDVQQVQMLVVMGLTMMVMAPIMGIGGIIMAIREDAGLSWLVAVAVPVLGVVIAIIGVNMIPASRAMQSKIDDVNRILREQARGIRVLRAFVREPLETARFGKANTELTAVSLTFGRWMAGAFPAVPLILNVSTVAVIWFGGHRIESGAMQIGSLIAFLSYLIQILMAVMIATMVMIMSPRATVSATRIGEVLDTESTVVRSATPISKTSSHSTVEFDGVSFWYSGAEHPVLRDISFTASPGETTAIVGSTGAGKTTLVSLIPRLFDPTSGTVSVDGVDVRDLDEDFLWSRIGFVPQSPYLFTGTVASNLRHGKPEATDDDLWWALGVAQAKDFVEAMPEGLDAPISQGGTNVSGGQRQRLAIARAVIRRPEIYLFDDSFSALDLATDARLRRSLRPITTDATVIVVAQRVSTIIDADRIIVVDDGAVVGTGTHTELLDSCPTYVEIVESQMEAEVAS
jgi:ATP-binding cassette subfamily B protein